MNTKQRLTLVLGLFLVMVSCSEVQKQVAIDELIGTYKGIPVVVFEWSKLNIGMEDQHVENEKAEYVIISKDSKDNLFIKFDDETVFKMNNINMAKNGAVFNIPKQKVYFKSEEFSSEGYISGLSENYFGESRCDGIFDSETNKLSFSFSGTLKMKQYGETYNVPIAVGYYELEKQ